VLVVGWVARELWRNGAAVAAMVEQAMKPVPAITIAPGVVASYDRTDDVYEELEP